LIIVYLTDSYYKAMTGAYYSALHLVVKKCGESVKFTKIAALNQILLLIIWNCAFYRSF